MHRTVSAAHAKAHLASLIAEVEHRSAHIVIARRGQPVAALIGLADLERLDHVPEIGNRPIGALALVGAWKSLGDAELDALVEDIYDQRSRDLGRDVNLEE